MVASSQQGGISADAVRTLLQAGLMCPDEKRDNAGEGLQHRCDEQWLDHVVAAFNRVWSGISKEENFW